jgi:hypothetical protein
MMNMELEAALTVRFEIIFSGRLHLLLGIWRTSRGLLCPSAIFANKTNPFHMCVSVLIARPQMYEHQDFELLDDGSDRMKVLSNI